MCAVSAVLDDFNRRNINDWTSPSPIRTGKFVQSGPSRLEFEALKAEVEELKKLVADARKQDEINGEPDCEMEEKKELLKKICDLVGIDIKEFFPNE